jgi:hypothetical protein
MPRDGAVIAAARTTGGHDGNAALVLDVRYPNGAIGEITLDGGTGLLLMAFCGADDAAALVGQSWRVLQSAVLGRDEFVHGTGE